MIRKISSAAKALTGLLILGLPLPVSAQATGSTGGALCMSLMLAAAHEIALHCGDSTDASGEQRYRDAQLALKTFVIESDPRLKGADPQTLYSKNEQVMHEHYSAMEQSVCQQPDHTNLKRLLETFTSVDGLAKLKESIKIWSRDTNAIGCL